MKVAVILPHIFCYGGCRRYMEIGNAMVDRGIDYTIYTRRGHKCDWFDFKGKIKKWGSIKADYILCGDPPSFGILEKCKGKIFIIVQAGGGYIEGGRWAKGGYRSVYGKYPFIVNNRVFLKYFPKAHVVEGGVNVEFFKPLSSIIVKNSKPKVLYYNSKRACKGANFIREELARIDGINPIGFQGLNNVELLRLYQTSDFLIGWETREGWSNICAEALACGVTVVGNGKNCEPFSEGIIKTDNLRGYFSNPRNLRIKKYYSMDKFSWGKVTDKLLELFTQRHKEQKKNYHQEWTK